MDDGIGIGRRRAAVVTMAAVGATVAAALAATAAYGAAMAPEPVDTAPQAPLQARAVPVDGPVAVPDVIAVKADAETGRRLQGDAPGFGGFKVRVDYYEGSLPYGYSQASAVFAGDADGVVRFADAHPVDGTSWSYVDGGRNAIPIGTVTVTEVAAPAGYGLDGLVHVAHVVQDGDDVVLVYEDSVLSDDILWMRFDDVWEKYLADEIGAGEFLEKTVRLVEELGFHGKMPTPTGSADIDALHDALRRFIDGEIDAGEFLSRAQEIRSIVESA